VGTQPVTPDPAAPPMPDTSPPEAPADPNQPEEGEGEKYDGGEIPRTDVDVDPEG
jgi:hypothetical protein